MTKLRTPADAVRLTAAILLLAAGLIHFWVAPEHFGEGWQYGAFMVIAGTAQLAAAALLLIWPARGILSATIAGNMAIVAIFVWAYSVGLPLTFSSDMNGPEMLTALALGCTLAEAGVVAASAWLLGGGRRPARQVAPY